MSAYAAELAVAVAAAREAGAIQRSLFERLERITPKGRRDVVTEADYRSEAAILGAIRAAFPGDALVAEESGAHGVTLERAMAGPAGPAGAARTWFIDPLDGTVNFANGIPVFCASVGLAVDGRPVVGVLYDPSRDELMRAVRGGGAWREGPAGEHRLQASGKTSLDECVVGVVHQRGFLRAAGRIRPAVRAVRDLGSSALAIGYVGAGRLDAYLQPRGTAAWDLCAAGVIAEEGGALVTALDGGPWFRYPALARRRGDRPPTLSVLAAAPGVHTQLRRLLGG
jgi:myo-inositol-1(or 4)-monophosphatase